MKALVVEIRNGRAAALREDGVVVTVKRKCSVGDTIELPAKVRRFPGIRGMAAAAAVLILCFGTGGYGYMTAMACSYVSVDMNPSVEFTLNRLDRVIGVEGINEDGVLLAKALAEDGISGLSLSEALDKTAALLPEAEETEEENCLLLNVTSDSDERADRLIHEAKQFFPKADQEEITAEGAVGSDPEDARAAGKEAAYADPKKPHRNLKLIVNKASPETRHRARKHGMSAGRFEEIMGIEGSAERAEKRLKNYQGMDVRGLLEKSGGIPSRKPSSKPSEKKTSAPEPGGSGAEKNRSGGNSSEGTDSEKDSSGDAAGQDQSGGADGETQLGGEDAPA